MDIRFYGMTQDDFFAAKAKLQYQANYINASCIFNRATGETTPLSDVVISAYHSPQRYYAEIQNRVNSLARTAFMQGLEALFITLTLPSIYHPMKEKNGELVANRHYKGIRPSDGAIALTRKFARFRHDRSLKSVGKGERIYWRVIEPHRDGTPHLHVLLFLPIHLIPTAQKAFGRLYCTNGHERKANTIRLLEGDIDGAIGYVMKYINKVLPLSKSDLLSEQDEYLNLWYAYHKIVRFSTSRTLAPLALYRLLFRFYDLRSLTYYQDSLIIEKKASSKNPEIKKISRICNEKGSELYVHNGQYELIKSSSDDIGGFKC
ncbi:hypothetical protein FACS1894103_0210 [Campylobacterota bacterium]|nr:hypothetical protein FACS1894103_0210 [Campylobacterota bacterium]